MYEDKTLVCKECGNEFVSQQASRNFTQARALRTSLRDARLAVTQERALRDPKDRCTQLPVLHAAEKL